MLSKYIIWSNENLNLHEWKDELLKDYPGRSDDELFNIMLQLNNNYLEDERLNLDIELPQTIIVIADLGLWDGRKTGYKEIPSKNIKDCLYSENDYTTWYVDNKGDFRCKDVHHDGVNFYLYRVYKDDATEEDIENLKDRLYNGIATKDDIEKVTNRIGDHIANVYGWAIEQKKK